VAAVVDVERSLDRDRVASMADEGGAAAAEIEAQPRLSRLRRRRGWQGPGRVGMVAIGALAGAALVLALRSRR